MHPVIKIGSTFIDVESPISIVLRNPVFNEDGTPGSFVFNFSVPLTGKIKEEISFSHKMGASNEVFSKEITIMAGSFNLSGMASIMAADQNTIEVSLPVYNGCLKNKLSGKLLTQLDLGEFSVDFDYMALARLNPFFHHQNWYATKPQVVDSALRFNDVILDDHDTFPGDVVGNVYNFVAPANGTFSFFFSVNYKVGGADRVFFRARKNNTITLHSNMVNMPALDEDLSELVSFSAVLQQGDKVQFRVVVDAMDFPHPNHPDDLPYYAKITVYRTSVLYVYSHNQFEFMVDRGYPYHNFTFLPVCNNNYFANASQSKFEMDEESLQVVNEKIPFVNFYDGGFPIFLSYSHEGEAYHMFNIISPQIFLAHIIKTMFEEAGINIINNLFVGDGNISQLCVYTNASINNTNSPYFSQITEAIQLASLLPEMTCIDFLTEVCKTLGIVFKYDYHGNSITFDTLENIMSDETAKEFSGDILSAPSLSHNPFNNYVIKYKDFQDPFADEFYHDLKHVNYKGSVDTLLDLPWADAELNDCYFVIDLNAYFYYNTPEGFNSNMFMLYSLKFGFQRKQTFNLGKPDNTFEYELPALPIMMRNYPRTDPSWGISRELIVPATFVPGRIRGVTDDDNAYHLMFYRGLQKDSNGNDYPLGSNAYQTLDGDIDFDNLFEEPFSFDLEAHPNSIFVKRFRKYLFWRTTSQGTFTFHKVMNSDELARFDFFRWHRMLSMDFMVKELKFEISREGLSPVEVTAMPRASIPEFIYEK